MKPIPYPLNQGLILFRVREPQPGDGLDSSNPIVRLRVYREKNPLPMEKQ